MRETDSGELFSPNMKVLAEARLSLIPKTLGIRGLISPDNKDFWTQTPYPHEHLLLEVYAGLCERDQSTITEKDSTNVAFILAWIGSLNQEQVGTKGEALPGRKVPPPLLTPGKKELLNYNSGIIRDYIHSDQVDKNYLLRSLRPFIDELCAKGVISKSFSRIKNSVKEAK